jgi:predicted porin
MKKPAFLLAILTIAALPAVAQNTSEFGILVGGSKLVNDIAGTQGQRNVNDFKFSNSTKEVYWGVQLEPGTWLRIKAEEMSVPIVALDSNNNKIDGGKGKLDHVDALIDYKFSEPFGSTGLFAGIGMYRQNVSGTEDTNAGLTAGVNADFPFSRRYGLIVESAYHWVRLPARPRYITVSGGLRISF